MDSEDEADLEAQVMEIESEFQRLQITTRGKSGRLSSPRSLREETEMLQLRIKHAELQQAAVDAEGKLKLKRRGTQHMLHMQELQHMKELEALGLSPGSTGTVIGTPVRGEESMLPRRVIAAPASEIRSTLRTTRVAGLKMCTLAEDADFEAGSARLPEDHENWYVQSLRQGIFSLRVPEKLSVSASMFA